jgi:hypothetical protein
MQQQLPTTKTTTVLVVTVHTFFHFLNFQCKLEMPSGLVERMMNDMQMNAIPTYVNGGGRM